MLQNITQHYRFQKLDMVDLMTGRQRKTVISKFFCEGKKPEFYENESMELEVANPYIAELFVHLAIPRHKY